jgi:hypothetical protein
VLKQFELRNNTCQWQQKVFFILNRFSPIKELCFVCEAGDISWWDLRIKCRHFQILTKEFF